MKITRTVKKILDNYESDCPGTKANLARILMHGKLGGSGKMVILPVDQGFEHGPARSFAVNDPAYDPHYHYQMAVDAGLSAYAAPLGMLEAGADTFAGQIPTILKVNSSNSWSTSVNSALTGSVEDALRLGCAAIGFTIVSKFPERYRGRGAAVRVPRMRKLSTRRGPPASRPPAAAPRRCSTGRRFRPRSCTRRR